MTELSISPPAGRLPGACEAPAEGLSYRRRVRDGLIRKLAATLIVAGLFGGAAYQLGGGIYIILKAHLAQILIANAWEANLASHHPREKPWPWADMRPIARMELPRQQKQLYILDNDSNRTLAFGPGLRTNSSRPGQGGNTVISGHRDTHFAALRDIEPNELIEIQTIDGRLLSYRVSGLRIVDQSDAWVAAEHGIDELTLVTCWPFDALTPRGPERLIVSAERIHQSVRKITSP